MPGFKIRNYRWLIVCLLFFGTTINYLDRQVIGLLKPLLEKEFQWTETDFARIIMAFTAAYATGLLFFGRAIDKMGTRLGFTVSIVVWSLAAMLHAVVKTVFGFGIVRVVLGLGESGNFPAAIKAVAEWFPKKERGIATGILNAGTSIGVIAALFIVPWILHYYRWQEVFWITGALGFVWLVCWLIFYHIPSKQKWITEKEFQLISREKEREKEDFGNLTETNNGAPIKWSQLFMLPQTWAIITGKFLIDPIFWFFLFWLPSYFSSAFHLDMTKPSLPLMIIYTATTIGCIGGGYLSSGLIKKGWPAVKARKAALLICGVCELSILFAPFATNIWAVVGLISLAAAVHQAWATNIFTLASDLFPKQVVSSVVGIAGMAGAVGGILFPVLVGYLLDAYKLKGNLTGGYNILFVICGSTYLIVWTIIHLLLRGNKKHAR